MGNLLALRTAAKKVKEKLIDGSYFKEIMQMPAIQDVVIKMNRDDQLYDLGVDNKGVKIRTYKSRAPNVYADRTIELKRIKGQKTSVVTLKDTGEFYESFRIEAQKEYFDIIANIKLHDMEENVDVDKILGLIKENKNDFISIYFYDELMTLIRKDLGL